MANRCILLPALLVASASPAIAETSSNPAAANSTRDCGSRVLDPVTARALYDEAIEQLKSSTEQSNAAQFEIACSKLDESARLEPAPEVFMNLALCRKSQSRFATAYSHYQRAAELAHRLEEPELEALALQRASEIAAKRSFLLIHIAQPTPGIHVQRDNIEIGAIQLERPLPIDPGQHVITASAGGHETYSRHVSIGGPADTQTVTIPALKPLPQISTAPAVRAQRREIESSPPGTGHSNYWPWMLGGVGTTALVVGGISGALALHDNATLKDICSDQHNCSDPRAMSVQSRRDFEWNLARVTVPVGVVAIGAAATWWVLDKRKEEQPSRSSVATGLAASWDKQGGLVTFQGRF